MKKFTLVLLLASGCASSPKNHFDSPLAPVFKQAASPNYEIKRTLGLSENAYALRIHSETANQLIQENYRPEEIDRIESTLQNTLQFSLDERGLARAADRVDATENDPTHYDAVWVRDNLWVYLGLHSNPKELSQAHLLLLTLADYFASSEQIKRFQNVIKNPKVLEGENGSMNAVHIRFDRKAANFGDVQDGGKPQIWNHKQNDALGLFLDLFCRAVLAGETSRQELTPIRAKMISLIPLYFEAVKFHTMADAGSWEEIERTNTSSIGLATSGLERLLKAQHFFPVVKTRLLKSLIANGYTTIKKQLALGGESPSYPPSDPHYRTSDAALLNLIYPAQLEGLKKSHYEQVLKAVAPLIGDVGIKRYLGDSYQSGNFWFQTASTDNTSSENNFNERGSHFIPGSEAQWFFDSWYSVATGTLAKRFGDAKWINTEGRALNRALAQLTSGTKSAPMLAADAKPVPSLALPESYNTVVNLKSGERYFVPSPITPLNWAKASLRLALETYRETHRK